MAKRKHAHERHPGGRGRRNPRTPAGERGLNYGTTDRSERARRAVSGGAYVVPGVPAPIGDLTGTVGGMPLCGDQFGGGAMMGGDGGSSGGDMGAGDAGAMPGGGAVCPGGTGAP